MSKGNRNDPKLDSLNNQHSKSLVNFTGKQTDNVFNYAMVSLFTVITSGTSFSLNASNALATGRVSRFSTMGVSTRNKLRNFAEDIKVEYEQ